MQKFQTTKTVLGLVTGIGVLIVVFGALAIIFMGARDLTASLSVAVPIVLTGLSIIIACQLALAQIETANNTAAMCDLLQKQIDMMQQSAKLASPPPTPAPAPSAAAPADTRRHVIAPSPDHVVKTHKGVDIIKTPRGYMAGGEIYYTLAEAEKALDRA